MVAFSWLLISVGMPSPTVNNTTLGQMGLGYVRKVEEPKVCLQLMIRYLNMTLEKPVPTCGHALSINTCA